MIRNNRCGFELEVDIIDAQFIVEPRDLRFYTVFWNPSILQNETLDCERPPSVPPRVKAGRDTTAHPRSFDLPFRQKRARCTRL